MFTFRTACAATKRISVPRIQVSHYYTRGITAKNENHNNSRLLKEAFQLAKHNQPDKALFNLQSLVANGTPINTKICQDLIESYIRNQGLNQAVPWIGTILQLFSKKNHVNQQSPLAYYIMDAGVKHGDDLITLIKLSDLMTPVNVIPTPELSRVLIESYVKTRNNPKLWDLAKPQLTNQSYFVIYRALFTYTARSYTFSALAFDFLGDMRSLNIIPKVGLYTRVLSRLKRFGANKEAEEWTKAFEPILAKEPDSSNQIMTSDAIKAAYEGRFNDSTLILNKVISKEYVPNASALTSIMEHARRKRRYDIVKKVYDLSIGPISLLKSSKRKHALGSISSVTIISLSQQENLQEALACFRYMLTYNVVPSSDAYGALIGIMPDREIKNVYNEARRFYMNFTPFFFNVIISRFAKQKEFKSALAVFKDMKEANVVPNAITYSAIISACASERAENKMLGFFNEMMENKKISATSIHSVMKHYMKKGNLEKVLEYYSLCEKHHITPNGNISKTLIDAYVRVDLEKAYNVLRIMDKNKVQVEAKHYAPLINAYGNKNRNLSSALMLYNEMRLARIEPDDNLYQVMAMVYSANGDYTKAQEFRYKIVKE